MDDITTWREGASVDITSDNDDLGVLTFGRCWPAMKAGLLAQEKNPTRYILAIRRVSLHYRNKRTAPALGPIEEVTYDRLRKRVKRRIR